MIIRRYLVKQVVSTSLVVVALLTLIFMGGQLIKQFGRAAMGRIDPSILFSIIGFRFPEFLILILPLGFFIGLMLVFGRLYVDHEMAVLNGSGISRIQLARLLIPLTLIYLIAQSILMVWMAPAGLRQYENLMNTQAVKTGFDSVRPREFISAGMYTIYAGALSDDRKNLKDVFVYKRAEKEGKPDEIILAKEATRIEVSNDAASVVDLVQGRRYEIYQGSAKYSQAEFQTWRLRIESDKEAKYDSGEVEALSFGKLLEAKDDPVIQSELGWRLFVPFSMIVALMLATALCEVTPRQGRYLKLFPALLIFASLIAVLMAVRTRITKDEVGLWAYPAVLLAYAIFAALFSRKQKLAPKIKKKIQRVRS